MLKTLPEGETARIDRVETILVDLPFRRLQRFARLDATGQTSLLVRVTDSDGAEGIGEAIVPCGPWWSGDSVETMKIMIDAYFAPAMIGWPVMSVEAMLEGLDRVARGNAFAKAGLEMACLDLIGRRLDVPVHVLLGGARRTVCPVAWPLASGDPGKDRAEIDEMLETGRASAFKVKAGAGDLDADIARLTDLAAALDGRAGLRVDPNESWSEIEAIRALPKFAELGVELVEQPVPRERLACMSRIAARSTIPVMIDEGAWSETDMIEAVTTSAAHVVSLKIMKSGGIRAARRMADIAHAGGIMLYMGTFLETGIGTAAGLQLAASLPGLPFGGEIFGPMLQRDDLLVSPIRYEDGAAHLPEGPGLGIEIDEDKLRRYARD
ncbi:Muconate cycloisomerase 1 [Roseivivax jejudonensis]|uniref:Muconate cycloisomerase 1 n=1 Tax=Roseivivax jejudonensis TaxID=1529041 RepID=A0A1X7A631_9RHOB|nr:muconate cycloisomerase family protein [Roseivivax jejudonensis]SLN71187.1 Muconate cycloisomerase 1 [Roseivivax jejudonensis]